MTQKDENALVEAAQRGELSAFNALISAYQQQAYRIAYRILGDGDSAADAMQDSFIKVYNRIHQFRGGSFKAWLFRVVINTCYDRMRGDRRRRAKLLDGDEILPEHDYRLIDAKPTPHEKAESSELMRMMMTEIRKLPKEQQQVLILCDLEGLAYHEAASVTGSNLGTVKSRLSRARAKMPRCAEQKWHRAAGGAAARTSAWGVRSLPALACGQRRRLSRLDRHVRSTQSESILVTAAAGDAPVAAGAHDPTTGVGSCACLRRARVCGKLRKLNGH